MSTLAPMGSPAAQAQPLDALHFVLRGSHLIEASAGTGKTWTIAALYVRWVLGHGTAQTAPLRPMLPQDVLVMTFTRAATRELSERIRTRLAEAAQVFRGLAATDDAFLLALLADYPAGEVREQAAYRLAMAAQAMDDAAVYTIDAWCQRMLREHSMGCGHVGQEQLVADEAALRREAVQDYWRQQLYPMPVALVAQLQQLWRDVQALDGDVRALLEVNLPAPQPGTLAQVWQRTQAAHNLGLQALKQGWPERADQLLGWVEGQVQNHAASWNTRKLSTTTSTEWLRALKDWAASDAPADALKTSMKTGWQRLTPEGLAECRKPGMGDWQAPPESHALAQLQADLRALPDVRQAARLHARSHVQARLVWLKRQSQLFGFADLLQRLDVALAAPQTGPQLAQRLREQFPVALVDEFQDTSPLQCRIFDRIYGMAHNRQDSALLLIGDPKQSIYGFRGADIHSYLVARRATAGRHHVLGTNFRSTAPLVAAVNRWFSVLPDAFGYREGVGAGANNPLPFHPVQAKGRAEQLHGPDGPAPALTVMHDAQLRSMGEAQTWLAAACAEQVVAWLATGQFVWPAQGDAQLAGAGVPEPRPVPSAQSVQRVERVQPKDIAVLVRTGKEAQAVRQALRSRGVASVYLSDRESVFASDEAKDLCAWLQGVAGAHDLALVRAALATRTVGLPLAVLHALATQDEVLDAHVQQMRELAQTWRTQGVQAMLRQSMHSLNWAQQWREHADGERRLTNVLHLAELLQTAAQALDGEHALLRWLAQQVEAAEAAAGQAGAGGEGGEGQTVRLESDDDVVKIVTIHKSKGLEYPLVCLPFAHSHRAMQPARTLALPVPDGQGQPAAPGDSDVDSDSDADVDAAGGMDDMGNLSDMSDMSAMREVPTERAWSLDVGPEALAQAEAERLREDLRLWYVALTRARHAVWVGWSAVRRGNGRGCVNHDSAAGHLLSGGAACETDEWAERLAALRCDAQGQPLSVRLVAAPVALPLTRWQRTAEPTVWREALVCSAPIDKSWTVASFSRLTRDVGPHAAGSAGAVEGAVEGAGPALHSPALHRADGGEGVQEGMGVGIGMDVLPSPGQTLALGGELASRSAPWHRFVKGPVAGNFLHDQLEWLASDGFALDEARAVRLRQRCERAGHAAQAPALVQWLRCVVAAPLVGPGVALQALGHVLPEMEFWLPAARLRGQQVDALCRQHLLPGLPRPALPDAQLHGMLMGFADLVFEHEGRYWVLDYKSNHLGPGDAAYGPQALALAVAQHRYDVQAALYLLALHRLLRVRLGAAYRPEQHLGGAVYLFLRGIDGPAQGCCTLPAPLALLDGLDAMLNGEEGA